jgi:UDP-glucuronate 4-epimerase
VPFSEKSHTSHPISLYAASKKSNELMAHTYAHLFGIPVTGLRFFTVYGPWGRPDMAIYLFTKAVYEGQPLNVFNHGVMMRDFTYVDDITESVSRMLELPPVPDSSFDHLNPVPDRSSAPYRLFNIGNSHPESLMSLIGFIEDATGLKATLIHKPMQPGDLPSTCADVENLTALTGFRPSTSLRDGVNRFVSWFREYHGYAATHAPQTDNTSATPKITA